MEKVIQVFHSHRYALAKNSLYNEYRDLLDLASVCINNEGRGDGCYGEGHQFTNSRKCTFLKMYSSCITSTWNCLLGKVHTVCGLQNVCASTMDKKYMYRVCNLKSAASQTAHMCRLRKCIPCMYIYGG